MFAGMDLLQPLPLALEADPDDIDAVYADRYAACDDDEIFDVAARAIAHPKRDPADSFILHAPLELLARRALLHRVPASRRDAVRTRMLWVAAKYERASEPAVGVAPRDFASVSTAQETLIGALAAADLDGVDAATAWFAENASTADVSALAPALVDSLAAAGHASIYFSLLPRVAPDRRAALALLRPLAHEVARAPQLRMTWVADGVDRRAPNCDSLEQALATMPRLGLPGTDFIFPIVHQVDGADGVARAAIAEALPIDTDAAVNTILRVAARAMLQDDPTYAPYGWTHCFTLPQAVTNVIPTLPDAGVGLAIAATYVAGFRAAESARDIDLSLVPEPVALDVIGALEADPPEAAGAAFHADDSDGARLLTELAARNGAHEDAHLAKYTLACIHASERDPEHRNLYLAAAAYLTAWWADTEPATGA
jgi:hypothetical protein